MNNQAKHLHLGIDTGGTFTDGVLLDPINRKVIQTSKVLTTHADLRTCIAQTLARLAPADPATISLVSLSTTLATNAIVEGKRNPVALLLIGYDSDLVHHFNFHKGFGTRDYFFVDGCINLQGSEEAPLDEGEVRKIAEQVRSRVDAVAVSSYAGPMNFSHEERAAEILGEMTGLPVVQAHHLTSELDSIRRATTASLNASLLAQTREFLEAVEQMLVEKGVRCPVMVVRGDGSIVRTGFARQRPVEIIHSGPATSAIGGQFLAQAEAALVVDMGGTTSDLCIVERGKVQTAEQGVAVGPYRTCVRTIKARSFGLGGDSLIRFDHYQSLEIGPERVLPLSHLCHDFPEVKKKLLGWLKSKDKFYYSDDLEFWVLRREPKRPGQNAYTLNALELLRSGPQRMRELVKAVGANSVVSLDIDELFSQGVIERAGLTPTDILHVTGEYAPWDREAALQASEVAAKIWKEDALAFAERVKGWITRKITAEIIQYLCNRTLSEPIYNGHHHNLDRWLFEESLTNRDAYLGCEISLKVPLVGIGAPANAFLPAVAQALRADFRLPQHYEVANAVGTVVGNVIVRAEGSVFPCIEGAMETGSFARVANNQKKFATYEQALAYARATLIDQVTCQAQEAGAASPMAACEEKVIASGMLDLSAWAVGKPGI